MIHYITTNGIGDAWVVNELRQLRRAGIPFKLHAMRQPTQHFFQSQWVQSLHGATNELYPIPFGRLAKSVFVAPYLFKKKFFSALGNALFSQRESWRARLACLFHFFVACYWSRQLLRQKVSHIHSQWAHSCGSIGMYGAWLLDCSFSFTGHAADLFRNRVALRDKIKRAEFIICISTFHRDLYLRNGARPEQLHIAYCGVDVDHFNPVKSLHYDRVRLRIRSSGRLVEKKGFAFLIDACKLLADWGKDFECVIAGSGPLEYELKERINRLGLADRITLTCSPLTQEDIPQFMHGGEIYCLPCVRAADDDIDGLPQMLMEAMACGLPVISTNLVGIPDLVIQGETGILVEPGDANALAEAIEALASDRARATALATAGRRRIENVFDIEHCLDPLLGKFRAKLNMSAACTVVEKSPLGQSTAELPSSQRSGVSK